AIPAFCWLAAQVSRDRRVTMAATLVYAVMAQSFVWQITGGGLPRSLAALLALLAVGLALRGAKRPTLGDRVGAGCLIGLAILSHLEWGIFAASGVALAFLTRSGLRRGIGATAAAALVSLVVIAPWVLTILARFGAAPFLSSAGGSEWNPGQFLL